MYNFVHGTFCIHKVLFGCQYICMVYWNWFFFPCNWKRYKMQFSGRRLSHTYVCVCVRTAIFHQQNVPHINRVGTTTTKERERDRERKKRVECWKFHSCTKWANKWKSEWGTFHTNNANPISTRNGKACINQNIENNLTILCVVSYRI